MHHPAHGPGEALADLTLRIGAVLTARQQRYVMMHLPPPPGSAT